MISGVGVTLAYQAYAVRRRRHHLDSLMKLAERFESDQNRERRTLLYQKHRGSHVEWTTDECNHIHRWISELDLAALVATGRDINIGAMFSLYGDVFIRSLWLLAPYIDEQREIRGRQFALPLASFYPTIVTHWQLALKKGYPEEIGWTGGQKRVSLREFQADDACQKLVRDGAALFGIKARLRKFQFS